MSRNRLFWALALITFLSLFLFLGQTPFHTKGEPREAVVALSMLQQHNWILPINNGVDMAYKPPFFHWCIAAASTVAGEVNEYTSRLPSAFWLAVMVMAGYVFFAKRRGKELAFLTGLLTLTSFEVHRAGVNCRVDMVLAALMVLAIYQLYKWGERGMRGVPWTGILCMSGAFLTKGPVGMVLPCLVVGVFLWIRRGKFWPVFGRLVAVGLAACVLPLLWYVLAWRQGGDEFLALVLEENVLRFLGKMSYESHINPWYYNVITVVAGWVPYTLLAVMSLFVLNYRKPAGNARSWWTRFCHYIRRMDDARLLSLLSIVLIFVFYCIPKSKRSVYLLPIYPFLAYFLAEYLLWLCRRHVKVVKAFGHVLAGLALLLLVAFAALQAGLVPHSLFGTGRHAAQNIAFVEALETLPVGGLAIILLLLLAGAAVAFYRCLRRPGVQRVLPYAMTVLVLAIYLSLDGLFQPAVLAVKSDKPVARHIATLVPPDATLYSFIPEYPSANVMHPFTLNFYLDNRIVPFAAFFPEEGYLVAGREHIEQFKERYGGTYAVQEVWDSHHRSCDFKQDILLCQFHKKKDETAAEGNPE